MHGSLETPRLHVDFATVATKTPLERMAHRLGGKSRSESPLYIPCSQVELTREGLAQARQDIAKMAEFMRILYETTGLTGMLAANQIGIPTDIFISRDPKTNYVTSYINSVITNYSDELTVFTEGCFSAFPGVVDVIRTAEITLRWFDIERGEFREEPQNRGNSRIMQHEKSHLKGVTCFNDTGTILASAKDIADIEPLRNQQIRLFTGFL